MSLQEIKLIDRIEVVKNNVVQIREATIIVKDDVEIAKTFHRWCIAPSEDYSNQEQKVQDVCAAVHTEEAIVAYKLFLKENENKLLGVA